MDDLDSIEANVVDERNQMFALGAMGVAARGKVNTKLATRPAGAGAPWYKSKTFLLVALVAAGAIGYVIWKAKRNQASEAPKLGDLS